MDLFDSVFIEALQFAAILGLVEQFQSNDIVGGITIFGDIALKAAVCIFDAENNRIGFAQK